MAADITEEFQIDLSTSATASVTRNSNLKYDFAFGSEKFFDATTPDTPYRRQTASYQKDQNDNSSEPGEQTLAGWWLRSQSSFHYGAGANFYEPAQDQNLRYRFEDSEGVDVWTPGKVSLLKSVNHVSGLTLAGSNVASLRTISSGVLVHDGNKIYRVAADGTVTSFLNSSTSVYTVCDDGKYAYWVTDIAGKGTLIRKPLSGSTASTADETILYSHPSASAGQAKMEYVKGRLIIANGPEVWYAYVSSASTSTTPVSIFSQSNSDYLFTSIIESPSNIYLSGYQGSRSEICKLTFDTDGGITILDGAVTVAEMPRGEIVHSMAYYLGFVLLGTSRGIRVAQVLDNGGLVYGPLIVKTSQPVYQFACSDKFAWATAKVNGETGLIRIDLGSQFEQLRFPYANDLQADGISNTCVGVAIIDGTSRMAFACPTGGLFFEDATVLRSEGYLTTGKIRFNTIENKYFKFVKERADYGNGAIRVSADLSPITVLAAATGNKDLAIPLTNAAETMQFSFQLYRDESNTDSGPILWGYQVKALPAVTRQRLVQYHLYCFDTEQDSFGNKVGHKNRGFERIMMFEDLEARSDIITIQDFRTGETFQGLIEECSFTGLSARHKGFNGFGGILTVTVRKVS